MGTAVARVAGSGSWLRRQRCPETIPRAMPRNLGVGGGKVLGTDSEPAARLAHHPPRHAQSSASHYSPSVELKGGEVLAVGHCCQVGRCECRWRRGEKRGSRKEDAYIYISIPFLGLDRVRSAGAPGTRLDYANLAALIAIAIYFE